MTKLYCDLCGREITADYWHTKYSVEFVRLPVQRDGYDEDRHLTEICETCATSILEAIDACKKATNE